ncbi:hypothetical protein [Ancylobacter radicis]|uniref:Uncharacterized protein n=1 Tax=Ancylobacter radicis TaxID=2836179 RepID=A0ABS5RB78_9HYPH|nr:hypothetical protein [Ancylobacter radicis]MBS9478911.1 hypothetical protein [Ancylobacter radicis]
MTRRVKGRGWLRTSNFGSSTASYQFSIRTENGVLVAEGEVRGELTQMVEARAARRATLVLDNDRWMPIEALDLTADGLKFRSLGDISFLNEE